MPSAEWLRTGIGIPGGGQSYEVVYRTGDQSSVEHLVELGPILTSVLGHPPFEGSLNLWARSPMAFSAPAQPLVAPGWLLVPVVICESAVGVAARKPPPLEHCMLEVFACDELVPKLDLSPGDKVDLRILASDHLGVTNTQSGGA